MKHSRSYRSLEGWSRSLAAGLMLGAVVIAAPALLAAPGQEPPPENRPRVSLPSLLREMLDRDALARLPNPPYTCRQASSWDRGSVAPDQPGWFANIDTGQYLRVETNQGRVESVMLDAKPGDRLELGLPVAKAGRYELRLRNTRAFDYGIFQFWVDGDKLGGPVDLYSQENTDAWVSFGVRELTAGDHGFTAEITGSNPAARARHMLGLDCLQLRPAGP